MVCWVLEDEVLSHLRLCKVRMLSWFNRFAFWDLGWSRSQADATSRRATRRVPSRSLARPAEDPEDCSWGSRDCQVDPSVRSRGSQRVGSVSTSGLTGRVGQPVAVVWCVFCMRNWESPSTLEHCRKEMSSHHFELTVQKGR